MRLALPLLIVALLAGLASCGGGSSSSTSETGAGGAGGGQLTPPVGSSSHECGGQTLRVTGVSCERARTVLAAWRAAPGCAIVGAASHASCRVRGYLCIAARQGQKAAVSCALPGHSILFVPPE